MIQQDCRQRAQFQWSRLRLRLQLQRWLSHKVFGFRAFLPALPCTTLLLHKNICFLTTAAAASRGLLLSHIILSFLLQSSAFSQNPKVSP